MIEKVRRYIGTCCDLSVDKGPVVVGLSGGADSVALLHVLVALGYRCVAAHCNFHLRGEESDRDERHARHVACDEGVEIAVRHFDIPAYCRQHRGVSVEMACRELRYEWWELFREDIGAQAIAVAHHRDDSVETVLLNMLRRTGVRGLAGIRPRNGHIVRPLLCASRDEVETYLAAEGIGYVVDSTNASLDYRRNRLRNAVIPCMRGHFPDAVDAIAATASYAADAADFITDAVESARREYVDGAGNIDLKRLVGSNPRHAPLLLHEITGGERGQVALLLRNIGNSGRRYRLGGSDYILDRGWLMPVVEDFNCDDVETALENDCRFEVTIHDIGDFKGESTGNPCFMFLDIAAIEEGGPLTVRGWRDGDRISPYGMKGSRKLSDIYRDAHLSIADKARQLVVVKDDRVLWAVGLRASRHYPVTPATKKYVRVQWWASLRLVVK